MDQNEPIIEDPYRRHRRVTPQRPVRRLDGNTRLSDNMMVESRPDATSNRARSTEPATPSQDQESRRARWSEATENNSTGNLPPISGNNPPRSDNAGQHGSGVPYVRERRYADCAPLDNGHLPPMRGASLPNDSVPSLNEGESTARAGIRPMRDVDDPSLSAHPGSALPLSAPPVQREVPQAAMKELRATPQTPLPPAPPVEAPLVRDPLAANPRFAGQRQRLGFGIGNPASPKIPLTAERPAAVKEAAATRPAQETQQAGEFFLKPMPLSGPTSRSPESSAAEIAPEASAAPTPAAHEAHATTSLPSERVPEPSFGPGTPPADAALPTATVPPPEQPQAEVVTAATEVASPPDLRPLTDAPSIPNDPPSATLRHPVQGSTHRPSPPTRQRLAEEAHKSGTTPRNAVTITVLSVLLLVYAFNIGSLQTGADTLVAHMNTSAQAGGNAFVPAIAKLVPWLLLIPVLVLFYAIMKTLAGAIGLSRKKSVRPTREAKTRPLDNFKKAADKEGVRPRYAYQGYLLLQPFVSADSALQINDSLESSLRMKPAQVREVHLNLLRATDRQLDNQGKLPYVDTVLDLLLAAQLAPRRVRAPQTTVFEPGDPQQTNRRR